MNSSKASRKSIINKSIYVLDEYFYPGELNIDNLKNFTNCENF